MTAAEPEFRLLSLPGELRVQHIGLPLSAGAVKQPISIAEVPPLCLESSPQLVWTNILCKVN